MGAVEDAEVIEAEDAAPQVHEAVVEPAEDAEKSESDDADEEYPKD